MLSPESKELTPTNAVLNTCNLLYIIAHTHYRKISIICNNIIDLCMNEHFSTFIVSLHLF